MIRLAYERKVAISILSILFITAPLLFITKGDIVLWFNKHQTPFFNTLFVYTTYLGTAYWYLIPFFVLLYRKRYGAIGYLSFGFLLQAIVTILLKHIFFNKYKRPLLYLESYDINLLDGVHYNYFNTFPSGHTTTIFSLLVLICLIFRSSKLFITLLVLALLVGISRIYLTQHFFIDVYAGAFIGSACSFLAYFIFRRKLKL